LQFPFHGTAAFDRANPLFANVSGIATFTGGSGAFASATGKAWVSVTAVANSQTTGVAAENWTGYVITPQ
jgi:hypothetical protein